MNQDIKGCTAARSEQETEWLMCEAMAEHMRSKGMDASAEQVAERLGRMTTRLSRRKPSRRHWKG